MIQAYLLISHVVDDEGGILGDGISEWKVMKKSQRSEPATTYECPAVIERSATQSPDTVRSNI